MKNTTRKLIIIIAVFTVSTQFLSAVVITHNEILNRVRDYDGDNDASITVSDTSFQQSRLYSASTSDENFSTTFVEFSGSGTNVTLDFSFENKRGAGWNDFSQSTGITHFTVGEDVSYQVSGQYAASHSPTSFGVWIKDLATGDLVMYSAQREGRGLRPYEPLYLGESRGLYNSAIGSLTGILLAGRSYEFHHNAYTIGGYNSNQAGKAYGFVSLDLGGGALPLHDTGSTLALLVLGFLGLVGMRKRIKG